VLAKVPWRAPPALPRVAAVHAIDCSLIRLSLAADGQRTPDRETEFVVHVSQGEQFDSFWRVDSVRGQTHFTIGGLHSGVQLRMGQPYFFRALARNCAGWTPFVYSATSVTLPRTMLPLAPVRLAAKSGPGSTISLQWTAPSSFAVSTAGVPKHA
jgi:hypothetical protein